MLEVKDLRAGYGRIPILNGIGFRVETGEAVGVLGHNGMGKTTLLKTLIGLIPATGGAIVFDGADITREPTHRRARRGLGYVPQGREIFPQLSVLDNLRMGARRPGTVERVLEDFPILRPLLARPGGALSGGQQQILAIARCMCAEPRLILLDEPTEGIQPSIVESIAETLARLRATRGVTLVVVEQHLEFVAALSSRVLVLQKGAILKELASSDLAEAAVIDEIVGLGAEAAL
ncbi:MAG TPA: ATP-binding cassette domain-containing protein [Alphaproteobacteria bacterium]|jgi:branched-chain amino acid transport system ATP-binding protein|nr:ATP-binding cassette domain-containing protein [Alphaproteobacteria bacterium]